MSWLLYWGCCGRRTRRAAGLGELLSCRSICCCVFMYMLQCMRLIRLLFAIERNKLLDASQSTRTNQTYLLSHSRLFISNLSSSSPKLSSSAFIFFFFFPLIFNRQASLHILSSLATSPISPNLASYLMAFS